MNLAERKKKFRQAGLWCNLEISGPIFVIVFFFVWIIMVLLPPMHYEVSVDLAKTPHAIGMPRANREDALKIAILRDGVIFLGTNRVTYKQLVAGLREGVRTGSERTAYIKADQRAKYGAVVEAIDAVHEAGIEQIVFITESQFQSTR